MSKRTNKKPLGSQARTGISLPAILLQKGQRRAAQMGRNFSSHVVELIRQDLEAAEAAPAK